MGRAIVQKRLPGPSTSWAGGVWYNMRHGVLPLFRCRPVMRDSSQQPAPGHRWYRFSLRTVLVAMLAVCFTMGLFVYRARQARDHRERLAACQTAVHELETRVYNLESEHRSPRPATWLEKLLDDPGDTEDPNDVIVVTYLGIHTSEELGGPIADDLLQYASGLTHLERVRLWSTGVTDRGLIYIRHIRGLTSLDIAGGDVTDQGAELLQPHTGLTSLDVSGTRLTDEGLEYLSGLEQMEELRLNYTAITDAGLEHLKHMTRMKTLDLSGTKISDAGLQYLAEMTDLESLVLSHTSITGEGLAYLANMSKLRSLDLNHTETATGLVHLIGMHQLESLDLWATPITDSELEHLRKFKTLRVLSITSTNLSRQAVEQIRKALPACDIRPAY